MKKLFMVILIAVLLASFLTVSPANAAGNSGKTEVCTWTASKASQVYFNPTSRGGPEWTRWKTTPGITYEVVPNQGNYSWWVLFVGTFVRIERPTDLERGWVYQGDGTLTCTITLTP